MTFLKYIVMLMLALGIVVAGFSPVQAKPECQMAIKMQQIGMPSMQGVVDCNGCGKVSKTEQKKSGCCDDKSCSTKCSFSSSMSINLPAIKAAPTVAAQVRLFYPDAAVIASAHLNSQERPPKSFA